jgi:tRNA-dihydrouridine synthase
MGCPVEKALKHNYGVALMGDVNYAARVVEMTVKNSTVPVSVKFRSTSQADQLLNFVQAVVQAGASWVTLHPRTPEQKRRGNADWSQVQYLKQNVNVPVIGNGDIQTADDVIVMLEETGCDMVMSGRALAARPWMLWQLGERWGFENPKGRSGKAPRTSTEEGHEYGRFLKRLLEFSLEYFSEDLALRKFRFHARTTAVWLPFGHSLYAGVTKAKNAIEVKDCLHRFFDQDIEMSPRTELRQ